MRLVRAILLACIVLLPFAAYAAATGTALAPRPPDPERLLAQAAARTLQRNVYREVPVIYPSPAYYNPYLRDSFWGALALGDRTFSVSVFAKFARAVDRSGDPPTMFLHAYTAPQYHPDDSAALLVIWAWYNHSHYGTAVAQGQLSHVVANLLRRGRSGYFVTPTGPYTTWWDAYAMPRAATLAYNQGLYTVALRCARQLGLAVPRAALAAAERAYRELYDRRRGYLPLSSALTATDASALTGEFLSLWLFGRPILSDAMVMGTLNHLTRFGAGFRVVALPHNPRDLHAGYFRNGPYGTPGDYQNGASWLLFDALSIGAAGLHGLPTAHTMLRARLALEFAHGPITHEFLRSDTRLSYYALEPPERDYFSWDAFVVIIDRILRAQAHRQPHR